MKAWRSRQTSGAGAGSPAAPIPFLFDQLTILGGGPSNIGNLGYSVASHQAGGSTCSIDADTVLGAETALAWGDDSDNDIQVTWADLLVSGGNCTINALDDFALPAGYFLPLPQTVRIV